jgi:nitroreductase
MELDETIEVRHSSRSFKNKNVSWKDVMLAIDSALKAPFAGNQNNLKFIVIENTETIKKISELAQQNWISESPLLIVVCSDDKSLESLYGERGRIYSRQHSGASIENLLLKLTDLGIDSCWVGAYTDELIKQVLNIPFDNQIEAIIATGYEQKKPGQAPARKRPLDVAVYWEKWKNNKRPTAFEEPNPYGPNRKI